MGHNYPLSEHLVYPHAVLDGRIPACKALVAACTRTLNDHAGDGAGRWTWSEGHAAAVLAFLGHCRSPQDDQHRALVLMPWQQWIVGEVYGWVDRDTKLRRFREALVFVGKKNGKTALAGGLMLYELLFGAAAAEVYSAATKQDQARLVWTAAKGMAKRLPAKLAARIKSNVHRIYVPSRDAVAQAVSREHESLDGLNASLAVFDEAAAVKEHAVFGVLQTSMAARAQPLSIFITTAQLRGDTPFRAKLKDVERRLLAGDPPDRVFLAPYQLESDEEVQNPDSWVKANPGLDVICHRETIQHELTENGRSRAGLDQVLVKHFNLWRSAESGWLNPGQWEGCYSRKEPPTDARLFIGVDLASVDDLVAVCRLWATGKATAPRWFAQWRFWIPEHTFEALPPELHELYDQAVEDGLLTLTPTVAVDLTAVETDVLAAGRRAVVAVDPARAQHFSGNIEAEGRTLLAISQGMTAINGATVAVTQAVLDQRLHHDGHPFLAWQAGNVVVYENPLGDQRLQKPRGGAFRHLKVDGITALVTAAAAAIRAPAERGQFGASVIKPRGGK